jgi:hypothetical protein
MFKNEFFFYIKELIDFSRMSCATLPSDLLAYLGGPQSLLPEISCITAFGNDGTSLDFEDFCLIHGNKDFYIMLINAFVDELRETCSRSKERTFFDTFHLFRLNEETRLAVTLRRKIFKSA